MCTGAEIAAIAAVTALGAGTSYLIADAQAQAQQEAADLQYEATIKNAQNEANANRAALDEQARQTLEAGEAEKLERTRIALRERASLRASSAGLSGGSIDSLFNASLMNENFDKGVINKNTENNIDSNLRQQSGVNQLAQNRAREAQAAWRGAHLTVPNAGLAALQGGFSSLPTGIDLSKRFAPKNTPKKA